MLQIDPTVSKQVFFKALLVAIAKNQQEPNYKKDFEVFLAEKRRKEEENAKST